MTRSQASRSVAVAIAVTLQKLMDGVGLEWTVEEEMVFEALRLTNSDLKEAPVYQLVQYVRGIEGDEQVRGLISGVKGKYHELLFEAAENSDKDAVFAVLQEAANHPGSDIEFIVDGEVVREVQLKAVATPDHVNTHLSRYPDIEVFATEEVARMMPGVASSGFENAALEDDVKETLRSLRGPEFTDEMLDAASTSILVSSAFAARKAIKNGRVEPRELKSAMGDLGVGLATAFTLDVLLS